MPKQTRDETVRTLAQQLLDDIEAMRTPMPDEFGPFNEGTVTIDWPNLSISAEALRKALLER